MRRNITAITSAKTIIVKVGTSTITHDTGNLNIRKIEHLVRVLSDLHNQGKKVILVTSGAIGVGRAKMGFAHKPGSVPMKQALAAIGQVNLMYIYSKLFSEYGQIVSQILLTKDVIDNGHKKFNAINTFNTLFDLNSIPIVNENDTISTEQIEDGGNFGDNDTLSAVVAVLVNADLLILLSDIDGMYDKDPKENNDAKLIPVIRSITDDIAACAGGTTDSFGTGGMITKISAAKICNEHGIPMIIANGDKPENIYKILAGEEIGTLFLPDAGVKIK